MSSLEEVILDVLETKQPDNVRELISLVQQQFDATLDDIEAEVKNLHQKGLVSLEEPKHQKQMFIAFVSSRNSLWFWVIMITTLLSFVTIIFLPETGTLSYIRYVFGFIFASFLPGYCLTETLFPNETVLDIIERITFSIGLSFAITALVGLFLSFTAIGLTLSTTLPVLGSLVIILAVIALIRKYNTQ